MPASQLKRLKASLREQGINGPQQSKKQKKQRATGRTGADRVQRNAALQQIRDSFNPFEVKAVHARPQKFTSTSSQSAQNGDSSRYRDVLHRPGVSKSAGEEMRRATLLPELRRRNKVGELVDRRIGEGDVDMTPEERAVQRFAKEKERKAKSKSLFDLEASDDEANSGFSALTHGGRRINDLAADDFDETSGNEESEDDDDLLRRKRRRLEDHDEPDGGDGDNENEHGRKKTKQEVMKEVIAKSKLHKYERQKVKEDDDDLRMALDEGFGKILGLLQGTKPHPPKQSSPTQADGVGPVMNPDRQKLLDGMDHEKANKEYDIRLKQLATDNRAKPSERTKTAEEKVLEEAERLKVLEQRRQRRMEGDEISDEEMQSVQIANAEGYAEEEKDDDEINTAAEFGFTSSTAQARGPKSEQIVLDDEDEFALDDTLVASGSEADDIEDVELSDDPEGSNDSDAGGQLGFPDDEEDEFVKDVLNPQLSGANTVAKTDFTGRSGPSFAYPCPRNHGELLEIVTDLPPDQLHTVIQRIRALYHPSLSSSNKESISDFSCALVDHVKYMGDEKQSIAAIEQIIRHLHSLSRTFPIQIAERFRYHLDALCVSRKLSPGDMVILTAIGSIYPTSDHWHQVVTPAATLMARWLSLNTPSVTKPVDLPTLHTGAFLVALSLKYQRLSKRYVPEALRYTARALAAISRTDVMVLKPHLANLTTMAELWKDKTAFAELFAPFLSLLKSHKAIKEHQNLGILLQQARLRRRPLELHHHKKLAIRTNVPKFEENFNPDKHYDPDKERSDASKLQKEYKRERKGALRELRKDANFIAREQLKEKREKDAAHAARERKLIAEINAEEGREANSYAREKARRTAKR